GWHGRYYYPAVGVYFGGLGYWGWGAWPYYYGYGYPYYGYGAYPPAYPYTTYDSDPVYVQQQPAAQSAPTNYWYYCRDPAGYYPYVANCNKQWMTVVPPRGPRSGNAAPSAPQ